MRIRNITPGDFPTLLQFSYTPLIKERDTIYLLLSEDHCPLSFLAAEPGSDRPVGVILALASASRESVFVLQLWVEPAQRNRGLGGALLDATERAAAQRGARRVWMLGTDRARPFYLRRGYEETTAFLDPAAALHVRKRKGTPVFVKTLAST